MKKMTANEINKAKNPLLRLALPALQRASKKAREQAMVHDTQIVIWKNNHVVKLSPSEVREQLAMYQTKN